MNTSRRSQSQTESDLVDKVTEIYKEYPNKLGIAKVMRLLRLLGHGASYEGAYYLMWWVESHTTRVREAVRAKEGSHGDTSNPT